MAEKVKKAKTPAKSKGTAAVAATTTKTPMVNRQTVAQKFTATTPSHNEIALLAVQYWAERGRQHGQHEQDWFRAERDLVKKAS